MIEPPSEWPPSDDVAVRSPPARPPMEVLDLDVACPNLGEGDVGVGDQLEVVGDRWVGRASPGSSRTAAAGSRCPASPGRAPTGPRAGSRAARRTTPASGHGSPHDVLGERLEIRGACRRARVEDENVPRRARSDLEHAHPVELVGCRGVVVATHPGEPDVDVTVPASRTMVLVAIETGRSRRRERGR